MLIEDFLPDGWWPDHPWHVAALAVIYSLASLFIAVKVFASNPGLASVIFLTLFLLPSIMRIRHQETSTGDGWMERLLGPKQVTKAYSAYFIGTFFTYLAVAFTLPFFGFNVLEIVREQLVLLPGLSGAATFSFAQFSGILSNNWFVLLLVFLFATIWRDGGMFFVLWNASAWGAIFGYRAMGAAAAAGTNPWYYLGIELSQVIWHTALEGGAYVLAAVAGSVIGRHAYEEDEIPSAFIGAVTSIFIVTFGFETLMSLLPIPPVTQTMLGVATFFLTSYLLRHALVKHRDQFTTGMTVFSTALALFAVGAIIETFVLENSTSLQTVYRYSSMFINS